MIYNLNMESKKFWKIVGELFKQEITTYENDNKWQKTQLIAKIKNVL